jgi:hypothetical protein
MSKLFAVDMDCTLTKNPCWTIEQCINAEPREDVVFLVNDLYRGGNIVIIWTARREVLRPATEYWLKKHGVFYHAIDMGHKIGANAYIDDRAINSLDYFNICKGIERTLAEPDFRPMTKT